MKVTKKMNRKSSHIKAILQSLCEWKFFFTTREKKKFPPAIKQAQMHEIVSSGEKKLVQFSKKDKEPP